MLDQTISLQRQNLLGRLAPGTPHAEFFREIVNGAFDIMARLDSKREKIARDNHLSEAGKQVTVAKLVKDELAPAHATGPAKRARHAAQRNDSRRAGIGKPNFAASDLAAGLERREIRDYLRSLPEGQRIQTALEFATDRKLAQAVLSGPSIRLTGLNADQFARVHEAYLSHFHADELAEITAMQDDLVVLATATSLAQQRLSSASGMSERDWGEYWKTLEEVADR